MSANAESHNLTGREIVKVLSENAAEPGFTMFSRERVEEAVANYGRLDKPVKREVVGPVQVQDPVKRSGEHGQIVQILHAEQWRTDRAVMMLAGAKVDVTVGSGNARMVGHNRIELMSDSRDLEGDQCRLVRLELDSLQFKSLYGNRITFDAWITRAYFYANEKQLEDADSEEPSYLPPEQGTVKGFKLPLPVEIVQYTLGREEADRWMDEVAGVENEES